MQKRLILSEGAEGHIYTVSSITKHIKSLMDEDEILSNVCVKGEVSNCKPHTSGHLYFKLKDEFAQIDCVMWRPIVQSLRTELRDGDMLFVFGRVTVYEPRGRYQLYVERVHTMGKGDLYLSFELLKKKLGEEGLFSPEHKKPLPQYPERIGLVTSPTGAVIQDILNILRRRWPLTILLYPVRVQGEGAEEEIVEAINELNKTSVDVIILARGGGTIEELWAFNEESVARAIYNSKIPIISAIGHETDFTISDLVSDMRAPTPSVAAEIVVPDREDMMEKINQLRRRIGSEFSSMLERMTQTIDEKERLMNTIFINYIESKRLLLHTLNEKIQTLNPEAILKRGYSITLKLPEERIISSITGVATRDRVKIIVMDGYIFSTVEEKSGK